MAYNTNILTITLDGTGVEIPTLSVVDAYSNYQIVGAVTTIGNYAIVPTGTPQLGTTFVFDYQATVALGLGLTFAVFGTQITQELLTKKLIITCTYSGSAWKVRITGSLDQAIIDTVNIIPGAIDSSTIANLSITTAKIDDLAVTTAKIDNLAVTTGKIALLAVTDAQLNTDSVITSKILNSNVTNAKLANMADNTIKGNISGGAATPSDLSLSTLFSTNTWKLTGNAGTTAGTNFVGTTDSVDLVFKVNSIEAGRITAVNSNTSYGRNSLVTNASGIGNTANGYFSLALLSSAVYNTAYGYYSLGNVSTGGANVGLGSNAGDTITTGNSNTCVGEASDVTSVASIGRIALGQNASADTDYQFALPNNVTAWKIRGNSFTLPSADGNAKAALVTDGSKVLSFGAIIDSGTYTPSLTNGTNVAASTAYPCQYLRVGNTVTVSGKVAIDATSAAAMELGISLPIASNFANDYECAGTGIAIVTGEEAAYIKADAANNRASLNQTKADTSNHDHYFTFTYSVI
jgi:hypothetical protein